MTQIDVHIRPFGRALFWPPVIAPLCGKRMMRNSEGRLFSWFCVVNPRHRSALLRSERFANEIVGKTDALVVNLVFNRWAQEVWRVPRVCRQGCGLLPVLPTLDLQNSRPQSTNVKALNPRLTGVSLVF